MVESQPSKLLVASSSLVSRFISLIEITVGVVRRFALPVLAILFLLVTGCVEKKPYQVEKKESPVTARLKEIVDEDKAMRLDDKVTPKELAVADANHRHVVYELLAQSVITEPEDLYRAALILYHTDRKSCPDIHLLAHFLAEGAVTKGYSEARYLAAATLDRYLVASGVPQRYGTQYDIDTGRVILLLPFDSSTTDEERREYDVPPLDSLKKYGGRLY